MSEDYGDSHRIIRCLLGQLPAAEQAELERRRAGDPEFAEFFRVVEEDLVDDFLRGQLAPEETKLFTLNYLATPERYDRVEFARALLNSYHKTRSARFWLSLAGLAVVIAIVAGGGTTFLLRKSQPALVALTLYPGTERGMTPLQTVEVPPAALLLRLDLHSDVGQIGDHAILRVVGSNAAIWQMPVVQESGLTAYLLVPAASLVPGEYLLTLEAHGLPIDTFQFRAIRK